MYIDYIICHKVTAKVPLVLLHARQITLQTQYNKDLSPIQARYVYNKCKALDVLQRQVVLIIYR